MPELKHNQLDSYLKSQNGKPSYSVYLIFGDELLYKTAFDTLLESIMPLSKRSLNYDPVDDTEENIYQIIERMNTFSLLPGPKAVAVIDSKIFYSKEDNAKLLEKTKEAYDRKEPEKAARFFVSLLGRLNLSFEDTEKPEGMNKLTSESPGDVAWMEALNAYCVEHRIRIPKDVDSAAALDKAIKRGFPKGNHLFITTDFVDRRKSLYKTILEKGLVVDCAVPKGDRREDRIAQEAVLNEKIGTILSESGKTIEKDAFSAMMDMTGFDLRTVSHNVEKLINFVGERQTITVDDVAAVLERTRKDPIYEMTNSLAERNALQALHFMHSLLSENMHPLQILAALSNQVRKLLMARGFLESGQVRNWSPHMNYTHFRRTVMPEAQAYDQQILEQLREWDKQLVTEEANGAKTPRKKKGKSATDLLIARNPNNAYPVYQTLIKAEGYSTQELLAAMEALAKADIQLKTTAQRPKLILESVVFSICGRYNEEVS
jgi:DNA polymerase-3 subunit delta